MWTNVSLEAGGNDLSLVKRGKGKWGIEGDCNQSL